MLYVFDVDGTLVEKFGTAPPHFVADKLAFLQSQDNRAAVATNQAGLAWRLMTQNAKFPDVTSLAQRFELIARQLPYLASIPWFISVYDSRVRLRSDQYAALAQNLIASFTTLDVYVSADPQWRKPQPGMLLAAAAFYSVTPNNVVYVGDFDTDAEAASQAGTNFSWAEDFFKQV
ncbi:MAG: HAD-IIIA family hydrolase [Anaerolineae bacterium]|nr:HAD-IIIA family hydrolase [Anaerolineae bacterium]